MNRKRIAVGTIILNHWAGEGNPVKCFIYTGISGDYATGLILNSGRLEKVKFNKNDVLKSDKFEPVGYCDGFDTMKKDLKSILRPKNNLGEEEINE